MGNRYGESVTVRNGGTHLSITRWDDNTVSVRVLGPGIQVEGEVRAAWGDIGEIAALFSKPKIDRGQRATR